ncbi:MAG: hypothetical protein JNL98_18690, partial [Bryobacterales bacterium]|nr:hypothetical protein [Bryobacterales bacterium]
DEAWKLARAVIFDYQKQLQAAGVGASLRAQMVNDSILLLDRLGQETIPAGYKLEVARAYVEMAMATGVRAAGNVGDQSRGRRALAKAESLLREYLKDHPGHREASRRLADVLVLTSDLGQVKFWKEASSILARLEREDANDRDTLWSLGNLHFWMAAAERTREAKVIQFEKSLDYFDRARKLDPTNLERLSAVSLLHKQLGNEYTYLQDVEKTCFHGAEAVRLDEIRLKERPDSVRVHMDLNTSQGILADCARFRGGDTAFLSAYRPVLEGRRRLFQKDPSNTHYRNRLATALVRGANALRAAGQLHDALAMIEEGMRLGDEIMREDLLWQRAATHRQLGSTAEACATFDTLRSLSLKQLERWKKTAEALNKLCPSR